MVSRSTMLIGNSLTGCYWDPCKNDVKAAERSRIRKIKGRRIHPQALVAAVKRYGGILKVIRTRAWNKVRTRLSLPFLTPSSGSALHTIWKIYFNQGDRLQNRGSAPRRSVRQQNVLAKNTRDSHALSKTLGNSQRKDERKKKKKKKKKKKSRPVKTRKRQLADHSTAPCTLRRNCWAKANLTQKKRKREKSSKAKSEKERKTDLILDRYIACGKDLGKKEKRRRRDCPKKAHDNSVLISWDLLEREYFRPPSAQDVDLMRQLIIPEIEKQDLPSHAKGGKRRLCNRKKLSEIEAELRKHEDAVCDKMSQYLIDKSLGLVQAAEDELNGESVSKLDNDSEMFWHVIKSKLLRGAAYQNSAAKENLRAAVNAFRKCAAS